MTISETSFNVKALIVTGIDSLVRISIYIKYATLSKVSDNKAPLKTHWCDITAKRSVSLSSRYKAIEAWRCMPTHASVYLQCFTQIAMSFLQL